MESTVRLPRPHSGQIGVIKQSKRINWLAAGRRWRKTTLCMAIAVRAAIKGQRILWGAPTSDQTRIGWMETQRAAGTVANFITSRMTVEFPGKGMIIYRSLDDPNNARGHTADGAVVDECADVKREAYYEVLRPMLMDRKDSWFWGIGTPKGRNWYWQEHENASNFDDTMSWQVPTVGCEITEGRGLIRSPHELENPFIDWDEVVRMFETMPEIVFRQEILAEFIEEGAGVFRHVDELCSAAMQHRYLDRTYVFGVDWGKFNDWTVISVMCLETGQMVYMDRFNRIDYTLQVGRLKAAVDIWSPSLIVVERNAMGEPLVELLQRDGLPVEGWFALNDTKKLLIDDLALAMERKEVKLLNDMVLKNELKAFTMDRLPSGKFRYAAPSGFHDDTVISLALAYHAYKKNMGRGVVSY